MSDVTHHPAAGHRLPERYYPIAGILFIVAFSGYAYTLAPGLMPGDTGDMVKAAATLSEAHPPGYPLYSLLGKLFTALPVGTIPYRANLMSAFLGGLSVPLVFLALLLLTRHVVASLAGALLFAFNYLFWTYFVLAETFCLNNFMLALTAFLALLWRHRHQQALKAASNTDAGASLPGDPGAWRYLDALAFLSGLSLGNHHTMVLTFPGLCLFGAAVDRRVLRPGRLLRLLCLGALGIILAYAYLPLAALASPEHYWEDTGTLRGLVRLFLRAKYGTFQLAPGAGRPTTPGAQAASYFAALITQYLLPGFLIGIAGLVRALFADRPFSLYCGTSFLLGVAFILKANIDPTPTAFDAATLERFYQLPNFFFLLWVGFGLGAIGTHIDAWAAARRHTGRTLLQYIPHGVAVSFLVLPAALGVVNYPKANLRHNRLHDQFLSDILSSLPRRSILLCWTDTIGMGADYLVTVERRRPDVFLILAGLVGSQPYRSTMQRRYPHLVWPTPPPGARFDLGAFLDENLKRHRVFADTFPPDKMPFPIVRHGLLYEILPRDARPTVDDVVRTNNRLWERYDLRLVDTRRYPPNSMCYSVVVFHYLYRRQAFASDCLRYRRYADALRHLEACLPMDGYGFVANAAPWHRQMARAYLGLNRPADAIRHLQRAQQAEPDEADTYALLAQAYHRQGDPKRAAAFETEYRSRLRQAASKPEKAPDGP